MTIFSWSRTKHHAVYIAAMLPWLFLFDFSRIYGDAYATTGMVVYSIPVVLCVLQFVFPTRIGWLLVLGLQLAVTGGTMIFFGQVYGLFPGDNPLPGAAEDLYGQIMSSAFLVLMVTITVLIARRRPTSGAELRL